jgi:formate dehydrogenase subunit gamma
VTERTFGRQLTPADVLAAMPVEERLILPCLQRIQNSFGYVTDDSVDAVAGFLNVSRAEVIGVLTYYHDLRRTPPSAVVVGVCVAEACQAVGARSLIADIEADFRIVVGDQSSGAPIEFVKAYCLGNCALGPAVMVNRQLIGRCDIGRVRAAVRDAQGVHP